MPFVFSSLTLLRFCALCIFREADARVMFILLLSMMIMFGLNGSFHRFADFCAIGYSLYTRVITGLFIHCSLFGRNRQRLADLPFGVALPPLSPPLSPPPFHRIFSLLCRFRLFLRQCWRRELTSFSRQVSPIYFVCRSGVEFFRTCFAIVFCYRSMGEFSGEFC